MNLKPLILLPLVAMLGCGDSDAPEFPATAPVTGTVTQGGKPVEGAIVTFVPKTPTDETFAATSTTDAEGNYTLQTYFSPAATGDGAVPGQYNVTVTQPPKTAAAGEVLDEHAESPATKGPSNLLPKQYANPSSTPLQANIEAGKDNVVPLEIK